MELEKTNERLADETGARRRESSSRISPRKSMQQPHADTGHPSVAAGTSAATGESLEQIKGRDAANQSEDFRFFFFKQKKKKRRSEAENDENKHRNVQAVCAFKFVKQTGSHLKPTQGVSAASAALCHPLISSRSSRTLTMATSVPSSQLIVLRQSRPLQAANSSFY